MPLSPPGSGMYSCLPEHVIGNYNQAMSGCRPASAPWSYLFWGARQDPGESAEVPADRR